MKKRKKIVIVSLNGTGNSGGVERVNYYLNEILSERYDVAVFRRTKISFGKLDTIIQPLLMAARLCLVSDKFVVSNSWHSAFYPADISIHHGTTLGFCKKTGTRLSFGARWISFLEKVSAKTAKMVLCVSDNAKGELIRLYKTDGSKIRVLNNFVDENSFHVKAGDAPKKGVTVLFAGRLGYGKGVSSLLRLSRFIERDDCPYDFTLRVATNDTGESEKFRGNGKTRISVGLDMGQMADFYNSGDVLYFPTLYEGFPMSTLEALSCGVPVVGSEYAIPDELSAFRFCKRVDNSSPVETACDAILRAAREFSGRKAEIHGLVAAEFGRAKYAEKLLGFVRSAMEGG